MRTKGLVVFLCMSLTGMLSCELQEGSIEADDGSVSDLTDACGLGALGNCDADALLGACTNSTEKASQTTTHSTPQTFAALNNYGAQQFEANFSTLGKVEFYMEYNDSLGDPQPPAAKVELREDCSNTPCESVSSTSSSTAVTGSPAWLEFTFTDYPAVTSGTKYWLVVVMEKSALSDGDYWLYHDGDTVTAYSGGFVRYATNSTGSWSTYANRDYAFRIYGCD